MDNPFAVIERRMNRNETLLEQVLECVNAIKTKQPEEKLISPSEACNIFNPKITRPTLQSWTDAGLLKSYRLGSRVWYRHSEIIAAATQIKKYKKVNEQSPVDNKIEMN